MSRGLTRRRSKSNSALAKRTTIVSAALMLLTGVLAPLASAGGPVKAWWGDVCENPTIGGCYTYYRNSIEVQHSGDGTTLSKARVCLLRPKRNPDCKRMKHRGSSGPLRALWLSGVDEPGSKRPPTRKWKVRVKFCDAFGQCSTKTYEGSWRIARVYD